MKQVLWVLVHYTAEDEVFEEEFKSKAEALRKAPRLATHVPKDRDECFTLKKYSRYGWRSGGQNQWDDWELEDDWDVTPDGFFDLVTDDPVNLVGAETS